MVPSSKVKKSKTIEWKFSEKHKEYIRRCRDNAVNVAEGAVRSGKTINNVFAFAMELERSPDKIHIATGSTVGNAKLNIGEANGYGLEHIFRGRSRWGKFKGNECLYVNTMVGERVVIFAGGMKADSFKSIRGNSYGMWIATEINLHHESMIRECFDRLLMSKRYKVFWDLNPSNPKHPIYVNYIDNYAEKQEKGEFEGGYNYEHFTIFDNASLTEERKRAIISTYTPGSIWYRNSILGERTTAEGLIYQKFADNPEDFFIEVDELPKLHMVNIGVDFGGNKSKHAFVATGFPADYSALYILASRKLETNLSAGEIAKEYVKFLIDVETMFNCTISYTYTDSAEQVVNRDLMYALRDKGLKRSIRNSVKGKVADRIRATDNLITQGRIFYTKYAETVKEALEEAVWDSKAIDGLVRLDDGTTDVDTLDAFEYSFSPYIRYLMSYREAR